MKESELIGKVRSAVYRQCQQRGYAAPADVLVDVGVLPKQKYEDWRFAEQLKKEMMEKAAAFAAAVTQVWTYIGELVFNMLVLVGAVKMSDGIIREMMGL